MKPFPIFKSGKHTAANGVTLEFSEDMLKKAVAAYDPALHEAPIVIGHPKDNHPAYGWIKGLSFTEDGQIVAEAGEINADFSELVAGGAYKKRSASWYLPDSPSNPKPGTLYLRHVGFLGAQPPAIKGLRDVSFSDAEEGVVEFADSPWAWSTVAVLMRGIRDWIIGEKGIEAADKILPNFYLTELEAEGRKQIETPAPAVAVASFKEPENTMTPAEIQAMQDENTRLKADAAKAVDFAERETSLASREAVIARKEIEDRVEALVAAGKLLPAQKKASIDFAAGLADGEAVIDFGEGDKAEKVSQREAYLRMIEQGPKLVEFNERSAENGAKTGEDLTAQELAEKATAYKTAMAAKGTEVSFTEAVAAAKAGTTA